MRSYIIKARLLLLILVLLFEGTTFPARADAINDYWYSYFLTPIHVLNANDDFFHPATQASILLQSMGRAQPGSSLSPRGNCCPATSPRRFSEGMFSLPSPVGRRHADHAHVSVLFGDRFDTEGGASKKLKSDQFFLPEKYQTVHM